MPGRFFLTTPLDRLAEIAGVPAAIDPDPPRRNVSPGQEVLVLSAAGWRRMRWGIIPVGRVNARGRPVMETLINARSETVFEKSAFAGTGRGVLPADGWYEWTGEKRRKTAWCLSRIDAAPLWFAAVTDIWVAPGGTEVPQVATVTCEPTPQVAEIHHRMGVLLEPGQIAAWLTGDRKAATALMRPYPDKLEIREARDVDWDAP